MSVDSLPVAELRKDFSDQLDFETTGELEALDSVICQDRAVEAIEFGMQMDHDGYHIFAMGQRGTGKSVVVEEFLNRESADHDRPQDICYVNNFDRPDEPNVLRLPAGRGRDLRNDMEELVEQIQTDLPEAFESEQYQMERERVQKEFHEKRQEMLNQLEQDAEERDFTIIETPQGLMLAPVIDGNVMTPQEFEELDEETLERVEENRDDLQDKMRQTMRDIRQLQQDAKEQVRELDERTIGFTVEHLIDALKEKYEDLDQVLDFLDKVRQNLLDRAIQFKQLNQQQEMMRQQGFPPGMNPGQNLFNQYRVNLLVDHGDTEGAPVVFETNPSYSNLVGRIEHEGQFGSMTTDFTMIKAGALHRANGGFLILEARDLLSKPFAWDALKRSLKNQVIQTEVMGQEYRMFQTKTLEPETIPLNVKVILLGNPYLHYLLFNLDEDFQDLFKVKADFSPEADWKEERADEYSQFVARVCEENDLLHFTSDGVNRFLREATRAVDHKEKISSRFGDLADLIREASSLAEQKENERVTHENVEAAVRGRIRRSNRIEEQIRDRIQDDTILIDTEDRVTGQVNGLAVLQVAGYRFGKPSRITARTHAGSEGVVNIDRETELGGPIHNKGMMILSGYLGAEFAQDFPLTLSATLTFEQTYEGVEGDSASSTELYALLSALSGLELRQDLAVTGSVNQRGRVQSIGGVNEKIEGFFRVCEERGLTGDQGVLIPQTNVKNLMLRDEVIEAVENGAFHIYPVRTVEEGIELLTGTEAGERREDGTYPEDTVKYRVRERLRSLAETVRDFGEPEKDQDS